MASWLQTRLREAAPELYAGSVYTTIEISAELAARQQCRLGAAGHGGRFSVRHGSALDAGGWGPSSRELTYVVLCEVRI